MEINPEHGERILGGAKKQTRAINFRSISFSRSAVSEIMLSRLLLVAAVSAGCFLRIWQINAMGDNTDEAIQTLLVF